MRDALAACDHPARRLTVPQRVCLASPMHSSATATQRQSHNEVEQTQDARRRCTPRLVSRSNRGRSRQQQQRSSGLSRRREQRQQSRRRWSHANRQCESAGSLACRCVVICRCALCLSGQDGGCGSVDAHSSTAQHKRTPSENRTALTSLSPSCAAMSAHQLRPSAAHPIRTQIARQPIVSVPLSTASVIHSQAAAAAQAMQAAVAAAVPRTTPRLPRLPRTLDRCLLSLDRWACPR